MTAPLTVRDFRSAFPEFQDAVKYPDMAISIRLTLADKFFSKEVWGEDETREHVMGLYAAHYLFLQKGSTQSGGALGVVSSKSVDGVSVSYDTTTASEQGAGFWNATVYGRELYQLMRIFGAGAVQI